MTIKSIVVEDDAEYFCQVSNKHGAAEAIFSIIVEEEKTKPTFLETLEDLEIKEGEEAEFSGNHDLNLMCSTPESMYSLPFQGLWDCYN